MAIKFNDYFEFPRELDMSPYTAATLAEKEGELSVQGCDKLCQDGVKLSFLLFPGEAPSGSVNDDDNLDNRGEEKLKKQLSNEGESKNKEEDKKTPGDEPGEGVSTKYRLRGIVVHSGQASGGHYYSFIQMRFVSSIDVDGCGLNLTSITDLLVPTQSSGSSSMMER